MATPPTGHTGREPWFSALQSRDFRLFWFGHVVSVAGHSMVIMGQGWLIYELTGSKILLGVVGLVQVAPAVLLTFVSGVVADKLDQRRLLMMIQVGRVILPGTLAVLCITEAVQTWHILAFASAWIAVGTFEHPARQAMFPHLIKPRALPNAVALNATVHPGAMILGPPIAGIVVAQVVDLTSSDMVAAGVVYACNAFGQAFFGIVLRFIHLPPIHRSPGANILQEMSAGVRYVWRNRVFAFLIGMTYYFQFFAISVAVLFPVFAKDILGAGPSGLGFLYTAIGSGAVIGSVLAGGLGGPPRWRALIIGGGTFQGVFLVLFAISSWYSVSLLALFFMGIGAATFSVASQSAIQLLVDNEFRGRVMAIYGLTHMGVRPLGEMQFGGMAALFSAPIAATVGGAMVVAFALLVARPNRNVKELSATPSEAASTVDTVG